MKTVLEYLEKATKEDKSKIAVIDDNKKYSYDELTNFSKRIGTF